ncbi:hypothetical protein WJX72_005875 [[Myrmecia] bisecta]|uniref:Ammonium transporter AmtB-like domain-containing protein n=1 Tax=[Myrmecia] bisecta TaxID=41462 RepID=A0AAW1R7C4_9CHLO
MFGKQQPQPDAWSLRGFSASLTAICALLVTLFCVFTRYASEEEFSIHVSQYYSWFIDVEIMVFLGFGCLMTFLRRYSYSAVGLNFLLSVVVMIEAILLIGVAEQVIWGGHTRIEIDLPLLINATFCAAAGMIAFGAVIGRATPSQLLWLMVAMVPLYAVNMHLVFVSFNALDVGGSVSIHAFGAYYGLAASLMLGRGQRLPPSHPKNNSSYTTDVFAMIGTLFLWIFWPSFIGALASVEPTADVNKAALPGQFLCIVNTVLGLLGATLATFATSTAIHNKLNMVHIQNATLAGGVAMGAAANLHITPGGALAIGVFAGILSTLGFTYLTPFLQARINLGDTCGVHNLHGLPGILGGLVAGLAALRQDAALLGHSSGGAQLGYQMVAILVTLAIASGGGLIMGWLVTAVNPFQQKLCLEEHYDDGVYWQDVNVEAMADHHDPSIGVPADVSYHLGQRGCPGDSAHVKPAQYAANV